MPLFSALLPPSVTKEASAYFFGYTETKQKLQIFRCSSFCRRYIQTLAGYFAMMEIHGHLQNSEIRFHSLARKQDAIMGKARPKIRS